MRSRFVALSCLSIAIFGALAAEWTFSYRPTPARYATYGGTLGDPVAPSKDDSKVAFEIVGAGAKQMFDAMAPDRADQCSGESGARFRSRDDDKLVCVRSSKGGYSCYFGFDLKSGKSVGGSIC